MPNSRAVSKLPGFLGYEKFFTTHGLVTCLHNEFLLSGSLGKTDMVAVYKDGVYRTFFNSEKKKACLEEGLALFSDATAYAKYRRAFKAYIKRAKTYLIPKYSSIPKKLSLLEFSEDAAFIGKFWHYYGFTEYPYTDLAFQAAQKTGDKKFSARLKGLGALKFSGREILNAYFFRGGVLQNLLACVSMEHLRGDLANYLYLDELARVLNGGKLDLREISKRKKSYSAMQRSGKMVKFDFSESLELNRRFTYLQKAGPIQGLCVNPGIARGRAVLSPMLADARGIAKIDSVMRKGDVLIAETTSPDVMMLCAKACAIVAEEGGLLSHAAIVSRELGIPGIVQATGALTSFKTGDYVEVDAFTGLVRKIKKPASGSKQRKARHG